RIRPGAGPTADMKTIVKANVKMFIAGTDTPVEVLEGAFFKIGDGDAIPGLELPLRHSSVGEFFRAKCSWKFGFGPDGRPASASAGAIPGNSNLEFEVEILEHVVPASGIEGVIQEVAVKKENGNRWFAYGDFLRAGRCFSQGGKASESILTNVDHLDDTPQGRSAKKLLQLYLDCINNLAACHLSNKDPFKAREACIKVIEIDRNNQKGLLRAGRASLLLHEYDESKMCFGKLYEIQQQELTKLLHKRNGLQCGGAVPANSAKGSIEAPAGEDATGTEIKVDTIEKESLADVEKQIAEVNIHIETTNSWLRKVEQGKRAYKGREKKMAAKIAKGLFGDPKPLCSAYDPSTALDPTDEPADAKGSLSGEQGDSSGEEGWVNVESTEERDSPTTPRVEELSDDDGAAATRDAASEFAPVAGSAATKDFGEDNDTVKAGTKKASAATFSLDATATTHDISVKQQQQPAAVPEHENVLKMGIAGLIMILFISGVAYTLSQMLP
ncbi:Fkbp59, partial [Symbiodinium microadriaticum]